jgi:hypothetical protein
MPATDGCKPCHTGSMVARFRHARLVVAVTVANVCPLVASAQANADLPRDVVMAILRNADGPGEPEILLGDQLPAALSQKVSLPRGARIIVTLIDRGATRVIGRVDGQTDSVRLWFADEFERRGYVALATMGFGRDAFRPAERSASNPGYCSSGQYFSVSARQRPMRTVEFVLTVTNSSQCAPRTDYFSMTGRRSSGGANFPAFPLLYHPRSAESTRRCALGSGSAFGGYQTTEVSIATAISPEKTLAEYGRQLDSAGWVRKTIFIGAAGTWTRRDSTGRDVQVMLTVLPGPGSADCRVVTMTATDVTP